MARNDPRGTPTGSTSVRLPSSSRRSSSGRGARIGRIDVATGVPDRLRVSGTQAGAEGIRPWARTARLARVVALEFGARPRRGDEELRPTGRRERPGRGRRGRPGDPDSSGTGGLVEQPRRRRVDHFRARARSTPAYSSVTWADSRYEPTRCSGFTSPASPSRLATFRCVRFDIHARLPPHDQVAAMSRRKWWGPSIPLLGEDEDAGRNRGDGCPRRAFRSRSARFGATRCGRHSQGVGGCRGSSLSGGSEPPLREPFVIAGPTGAGRAIDVIPSCATSGTPTSGVGSIPDPYTRHTGNDGRAFRCAPRAGTSSWHPPLPPPRWRYARSHHGAANCRSTALTTWPGRSRSLSIDCSTFAGDTTDDFTIGSTSHRGRRALPAGGPLSCAQDRRRAADLAT